MRIQKNVGGTDRLVRGALGALLLVAGVAALAMDRTLAGSLALVVAAGLLFNAVFQFCGLNALLSVNTCSVDLEED